MLGWHFLQRRDETEAARLRGQIIELGTQVVFLQNALEHARRPKREPRKDKQSVKAAKAAMTDALRRDVAAAQDRRFKELAPVLFKGLAG